MKKTTIMGLEEKYEVLIIYLFPLLGFIFSFMNYDYLSENIRFQYKQSGVIFIIDFVLSILSGIYNFGLVMFPINVICDILSLVIFIFGVITVVKAFNDETYEIPIISNLAKSMWN